MKEMTIPTPLDIDKKPCYNTIGDNVRNDEPFDADKSERKLLWRFRQLKDGLFHVIIRDGKPRIIILPCGDAEVIEKL